MSRVEPGTERAPPLTPLSRTHIAQLFSLINPDRKVEEVVSIAPHGHQAYVSS